MLVVTGMSIRSWHFMQVLRREIIKSGEQNIQQPVNLKRLLWNAQRVFDKEQGGKVQSSESASMQSKYLPLYGNNMHSQLHRLMLHGPTFADQKSWHCFKSLNLLPCTCLQPVLST